MKNVRTEKHDIIPERWNRTTFEPQVTTKGMVDLGHRGHDDITSAFAFDQLFLERLPVSSILKWANHKLSLDDTNNLKASYKLFQTFVSSPYMQQRTWTSFW